MDVPIELERETFTGILHGDHASQLTAQFCWTSRSCGLPMRFFGKHDHQKRKASLGSGSSENYSPEIFPSPAVKKFEIDGSAWKVREQKLGGLFLRAGKVTLNMTLFELLQLLEVFVGPAHPRRHIAVLWLNCRASFHRVFPCPCPHDRTLRCRIERNRNASTERSDIEEVLLS